MKRRTDEFLQRPPVHPGRNWA